MILKKEIVEKLSKELSLPYTGTEQDWDLEMADFNRLADFLNYYNQNTLSKEEGVALMALILASYDDFLLANNEQVDEMWAEIKQILESQRAIFVELLNYWGLDDLGEDGNAYRITPLIRELNE